jgi:hypothetical protein
MKKKVDEDPVFKKLEEMDNKLERIKSDTNSLNRVACISNSEIIVKELWKAVGKSEVRAAILHLTKDEISATDLVKTLGINLTNLARDMKPFMGNKGIIAEIRKGRNKYFQRSELVDLVGFENEKGFAELLKFWEDKRTKEEGSVPPKEDANVT